LRILALGMIMFVVLFLFIPCYVVPVNAAEIFSDGFESGDFSAWTGIANQTGNVLEVQDITKYQGNYAAHAILVDWNNWALCFYRTFDSSYTTLYARVYVRFASFPASGYRVSVVSLCNAAWPYHIVCGGIYNDAGTVKWELYYLSSGSMVSSLLSTPMPQTDIWYCVEIKCVVSGTDGEARFYLGGTELLSATGLDNDDRGNINMIRVGVDNTGGTGSRETFWDCVVVADAYIGPEKYLITFDQTGLDNTAVDTVVTVDGVPKTFNDLPFSMWVSENTQVSYTYESIVASSVSGKRFALIDVTGPASPFTVTSSVDVAGNYKTQYYLTVQTDPPGLATIAGEGWYDECENVILTAPSVEGYEFRYWDVDGGSQGDEVNPITVHIDAPHTATAHYTEIPPLSVSISPATAKIKIGESVIFTSDVSGGKAPYSYQWYLDGSAVSGATDSSWIFAPETTGSYTVYLVVTDSLGNTAQSDEAAVNVAPSLSVSISPTSASIVVGESVEFTSTVSGGYPPYSYQWYLDDSPVSGATSSTWTFTPTSEGNYYIYLKVTDAEGNVAQSETAKVTASAVPVGGYSVSLSKNDYTLGLINYTVVMALFSVALSLIRRKRK